MRFRRSTSAIDPEPLVDPSPMGDKLPKPPSDLLRLIELARDQGFEVFPRGAFEEIVGELLARAETAEAKFREALGLGMDVMRVSHEERRQTARCEHEASLLSAALVGGIPDNASQLETEGDPDDD